MLHKSHGELAGRFHDIEGREHLRYLDRETKQRLADSSRQTWHRHHTTRIGVKKNGWAGTENEPGMDLQALFFGEWLRVLEGTNEKDGQADKFTI